MNLVHERTGQLRHLSTWRPTWCRVEAHLTQPAIARYRQMFPKEVDVLTAESLPYSWKATQHSCEVTPLKASPLTKNYQGFLNTALCLLLQTHFVNSPFDDLELDPSRVDARDGKVAVRTGDEQDLGIFIDPLSLNIETKTKSRGVLNVDYQKQGDQLLPVRLEQRLEQTHFVIDQLEYGTSPIGDRRPLKSFALLIGEDKALAHSQVSVSECQNF